MALQNHPPDQSKWTEDPYPLLWKAKNGVQAAREALIEKYTPFVLRVVSGTSRRYINLGEDDEASIGLMAFNEAIDAYDGSKGASFLAFAEMLVRRRLVDFFRRERKGPYTVPLSTVTGSEDNETESWLQVEARHSMDAHLLEQEALARQMEIREYVRELKKYGLTMEALVELTPKHADARNRALQVARLVADNPLWCAQLLYRKELPIKELEQVVAVSRKTLERQRRYILALVLAMTGDYPFLQTYLADRRMEDDP